MMTIRPTMRELSKKLRKALESIKLGKTCFANINKVFGELDQLDVGIDQTWSVLQELLAEIKPEDYAGTSPPQKSYEKSIQGKELFAFCWQSARYNKRLYIKFVLKEETFVYVSLHPTRSPMTNSGHRDKEN